MSIPSSTAAPLRNWTWSSRNILAVSAAVVMCWALLQTVLYCDTSYRATWGANRCTLVGLWVSTFYNDVKDLFHGGSASISGETTATEWTQCLFVPFIVAWMVYWLWPRLREMPVSGSRHGYALLGAGLMIYVIGYMAENYYIGMVAMQLVYAGLIVLFLGWRIFLTVAFPWAFLMFMWPYGFFEDVAEKLRKFMTFLSHCALIMVGVPNLQEGTAIRSVPGTTPVFGIDIADPCSGIRSLFALVMMAVLAAFVLYRKLWQQLIIIALSVPLVILGNLVRIMMLTIASMHFGEKFALGENDHPSWFHEGAGYVVYLINFGCLLLVGWFLTKLSPDKPARPEEERA